MSHISAWTQSHFLLCNNIIRGVPLMVIINVHRTLIWGKPSPVLILNRMIYQYDQSDHNFTTSGMQGIYVHVQL